MYHTGIYVYTTIILCTALAFICNTGTYAYINLLLVTKIDYSIHDDQFHVTRYQ